MPDTYEHRRYGNDHDRYGWDYSARRAPLRIGGEVKAGAFIVVPLEFFPLNPSGKPFLHPGAMVTPYPDLRHYTTRDYGLRVGVYRILKELESRGLKATFAVNALLLDYCAPLIDRIRAAGHEIAAHGLSTDHIHHAGLSLDEERHLISETCARFDAHGLRPTTWMSPARTQSFNTPDLVREAGFTACLDWEMDQVPIAMKTNHGALDCLPLLNELNDVNLLTGKRQTESEWVAQILAAARLLLDEHARRGAQLFGFTLTPYVVGQPFRIHALRELLDALVRQEQLLLTSASDLLDAFKQPAE
ncbi:polysaccharide deacetylase family protein [Hyphomonas johnsonii]|uniref:Chitooligosaccharide deacetylase n=1 Tax=Hyphomonas johnsonii MHS-2 TaxID=1280950 RepID=A0A059FGC2_9PROT|nr:polysaccharide deacetylase family protein [Hyphomonas johnsonii]KCZ89528.1 polysaccharide deacetylase family protein [Hyphomonas johnsonii MHS-2]